MLEIRSPLSQKQLILKSLNLRTKIWKLSEVVFLGTQNKENLRLLPLDNKIWINFRRPKVANFQLKEPLYNISRQIRCSKNRESILRFKKVILKRNGKASLASR